MRKNLLLFNILIIFKIYQIAFILSMNTYLTQKEIALHKNKRFSYLSFYIYSIYTYRDRERGNAMNEPLYRVIYSDIKQSILDSTFPIGTQLPTDKELTETYDVSTITIKKAMDLLKEDRLISRKPRKGTYVIQNKPTSQPIFGLKNPHPLVGLILTDFDEFFGTDTLKSIIQYSNEKAQILLKISGGDPSLEESHIDELITLGVDGLMILPSSSQYISPKLLELVSTNFPVVLIDRFMGQLPTCNVQIDNERAAMDLIEHLFKNGHQHIGILTANNQLTTNEERIKGAVSAHISHHIPVKQSQLFSDLESMIPNSHVSTKEDVEKIKNFLQNEPELTALFTGEYTIALLAKQAIEELGKQVGKDYSVVCFDHPKTKRLDKHAFIFTHILQDQEAIGKHSLDLLLKKIEQPTLIEKITAPHHLVEGMSVRKLN